MKKYKLNKLEVSRLHNAEFAQFLIRFFEDFDKSNISLDKDIDFKNKFEALNNDLPAFNRTLNQVRAKEESKQLAIMDKHRSDDMKAFRDALNAYKNSRNENYKKAYTVLNNVIFQYKKVESNNYEEQTILINSLINKFKEEECSKYIYILKLKEFLDTLEKSNIDFNELFSHRSYNSSKKMSVNVLDLRRKMTSQYKVLADYILALANVKESEYYVSILAIINNIRNYYADILARRDGFSKKKEINAQINQ